MSGELERKQGPGHSAPFCWLQRGLDKHVLGASQRITCPVQDASSSAAPCITASLIKSGRLLSFSAARTSSSFRIERVTLR